LTEQADGDDDKRARLIVAGSMALQHVASSSTNVYNWYAPWLVELTAIEVPDEVETE
jgi:hypothetical protein